MSISHSPEQIAIAQQIIEELGAYQSGLRGLIERRWDPELYRDLSDRFDRIQMYAEALPQLAGIWTELLITRVELTHALWTVRAPTRINGRVVAFHARHSVLISEMRASCAEYLQAIRPLSWAPRA
jgi:hypothetical protein